MYRFEWFVKENLREVWLSPLRNYVSWEDMKPEFWGDYLKYCAEHGFEYEEESV